ALQELLQPPPAAVDGSRRELGIGQQGLGGGVIEQRHPCRSGTWSSSERPQAVAYLLKKNGYSPSRLLASARGVIDSETLGWKSGEVILWEMSIGRPWVTLRGHTSVIWSLSFSPDGRTLATASGDKTIKLWEVASGKERATLRGHTKGVAAVTFLTD